MKKIILFVFAVVISLFLTGCGVKKELSAEEFTKTMSEQGFTVNDYTDLVKEQNQEKLLIAKKSEYEIDFQVYKTEDDAKKAFSGNKKAFKNYKNKNSVEKSKKINNYEKYTLELSDRYDAVIRNGKTLIYASINLQHKKDLNNVISNMGY